MVFALYLMDGEIKASEDFMDAMSKGGGMYERNRYVWGNLLVCY